LIQLRRTSIGGITVGLNQKKNSIPGGTTRQPLFDVTADARHAFNVLKGGGTAIVPNTIGYSAIGGSGAALRRIFEAKRRSASKRNAMVANLAIQREVQRCSRRGRAIISAIVEDYDLPLGCIAPCRLDHPMIAKLDNETVSGSTWDNGTVAILLNAGRFHAALTRLSEEAMFPLFGSSANLSLTGTKFRVEDIEPEIISVADIVIDHGLQPFHRYQASSTLLNVESLEVVRFGSCYPDIAYIMQRYFRVELPKAPARGV
jgi:tRNA A37 threonylcarbamoyladenosine synthetase subunit TsaC/SUA5/YrdC